MDMMRKVIASPFITLDGFIVGSQGELDWAIGGEEFDCEMLPLLLKRVDAVVLGRVTYQELATYWPSATTEDDHVISEFVTLDRVMEAPDQWEPSFWNEEATQYKFNELMGCGALLLGRKTYDVFAAAWPSIIDETGIADRMDSLPKYVVSTTLSEVTWNASLIKSDVVQEISRLKQEEGQDLLIYGSGELAHRIEQDDLIDEYRLMVHPIVVGDGMRLFQDAKTTPLKLVETRTFSTGVVVLTYQRLAQA